MTNINELVKKIFFIWFLFMSPTAAFAATGSDSNIQLFLKEVAPQRNPQKIMNYRNQMMANIIKIGFPANDYSLQYLDDYAFDAVKNVDFVQSLQKLLTSLPKNIYDQNKWLTHLQDSTSVPNEYLSTPNGKLIKLYACIPHNCTTNVSLLYNPQTKELWGFLHQDNGKSYLLGEPTDIQLALLLLVFDKI